MGQIYNEIQPEKFSKRDWKKVLSYLLNKCGVSWGKLQINSKQGKAAGLKVIRDIDVEDL